MYPAHYIIFHPDNQRDNVPVTALALVSGKIINNWQGRIFCDKVGIGNEDPFIFNSPWLYSYCHATQLRRTIQQGPFLKKGSMLFFVSGQDAEKDLLSVDTFFIIDSVELWGRKPVNLPVKYSSHFQNPNSPLWKRHLRSPFCGIHTSVSHTYEALMWREGMNNYSYLPLTKYGNRVQVPINSLGTKMANKIKQNIYGKRPVLIDEEEAQQLYEEIELNVYTKVLKINMNQNFSPLVFKKCY